MVSTGSPQARIDEYLCKLREGLKAMPADQVTDIVEEIRSHILDAAGPGNTMTEESVLATLRRLGPASTLATTYVTQNLLAQAAGSRSPWMLLKSTYRWAALSLQGLAVFLGSLLGYSLAAIFSFCALAKPINPHRVGVWRVPDGYSLHLGLSREVPQSQELLGWWLIPIALIASFVLVVLTTEMGVRTIRRFQRERQPVH